MSKLEATTFVIVGEETEKELIASPDGEMIHIYLNGKELFRMDAENFKNWSNMVNRMEETP